MNKLTLARKIGLTLYVLFEMVCFVLFKFYGYDFAGDIMLYSFAYPLTVIVVAGLIIGVFYAIWGD